MTTFVQFSLKLTLSSYISLHFSLSILFLTDKKREKESYHQIVVQVSLVIFSFCFHRFTNPNPIIDTTLKVVTSLGRNSNIDSSSCGGLAPSAGPKKNKNNNNILLMC